MTAVELTACVCVLFGLAGLALRELARLAAAVRAMTPEDER